MNQLGIEDLKYEIHLLKKRQWEMKSENQLMKVKIRKLIEEVNKKNRQVASLIDPKKADSVRKLISQHGATLIMSLRDDNLKLQKQLTERDLVIKKLQYELQTLKLYGGKGKTVSPSPLKLIEAQEALLKIEDLSESFAYKTPESSVNGAAEGSSFRALEHSTYREPDGFSFGQSLSCKSTRRRSRSVNPRLRTRSMSPKRKQSKSVSDLERSCLILLNNNLKTIKEFGNIRSNNPIQKRKSARSISPEKRESLHVNIPPVSSKPDGPHTEVQQLQNYFVNVLNEIDYLKDTIMRLQTEQAKTSLNLEDKCSNIQKLSSEIKNLKLNAFEKMAAIRTWTQTEDKGTSTSKLRRRSRDMSNPDEVETQSVMSNIYASSVSSGANEEIAKKAEEPKHIKMKSTSMQTTRSFCPPIVFTNKGDCKVDKVMSAKTASIAPENGIEVEYIN